MKMTLLNANTVVLTPLGWTILAFFLVQLIAAIKFINSLYTKQRLLEAEVKDNKENDLKDYRELKESVDEVKSSCSGGMTKLRTELGDRLSEYKADKSVLFKEIKRVEAKVDTNKDAIAQKHSEMAQGLVGAEREIRGLEKRVDKLEK